MPNLKDLRCLISVYDAKGFARAAEILNITQSSVSIRIRKLEEEFEGPLFERLHRRIVPTRKGDRVYKYAKEVIERVDEGAKQIRDNEAA